MGTTPLSIEDLLQHGQWLRRLARGLAGDDAHADDLVQDTWLAALRRPPGRKQGSMRGWLATVLRNRRLDGARASAVHGAEPLEAAARVCANEPAPDDLIGRVELQRLVAERLLALEEPYRRTVLLRYFDGLSAEEIGRQTSTAAGTVRWRLKVALDRLREDLDRRTGDAQSRWLVQMAAAAVLDRKRARIPRVAWALGLLAFLPLGLALRSRDSRTRSAPSSRPELATVTPAGRELAQTASPVAALGPPVSGEPAKPAAGRTPRFAMEPGSTGGGRGREPKAGASALPDCQAEVARLRPEAMALASVVQSVEPAMLFARGDPNPAAEAMIGPIIDPLIKTGLPSAPPHRLECRTWVCRLTVLLTSAQRDWPVMWSQAAHRELRLRITRQTVGAGPNVEDALSRESLRQAVVHLTLLDPSARPRVADGPDGKITLRPVPAPSPTNMEECRRELALLRQSVAEGGDREQLEVHSWLGQLAKDFEASTAPETCYAKSPADGLLGVRYTLRSEEGARQHGIERKVTAQYAGPLAATPLGACIAEEIRRRVLSNSPPPTLKGGAVVGSRFQFPRR